MRARPFVLLLLAAAACTGPAGDTGDPGDIGPIGPQGPIGPPGPLANAPLVSAIAPASGSWKNVVTLTGENFLPEEGDEVLVLFDGAPAPILAVTATSLVVRPAVEPVVNPTVVDVSVLVGNQVSNAIAWRVLPSGALEDLAVGALSYPLGVDATSSAEVLVADGRSGLLAVDVALRRTSVESAPRSDSLTAIARHPLSGDVFLAERVGPYGSSRPRIVAVDRATGTRRLVVDESFLLDVIYDMTFDAAGNLFFLDVSESGGGTKVLRLLADGTLNQSWGAFPESGASLTVLGGNLYVTTTNGKLYRFDTAASYPATATEIALTPVQTWLRGVAADPGSMVLRAVGSGSGPGAVVTITPGGAVTIFAVPPTPPADFMCMAGWWACTQDLTRAPDGTLFFTQGRNLMKLSGGALSVVTGGFGRGMAALGSDVYWTEFCNDDIVPRPLMRLLPGGDTEVVATGFCSSKVAASGGAIVGTNVARDEVLSVDPVSGLKTVLFDAADGIDQPIAVGAGAGGELYVVHSGTSIAKNDGGGFLSGWGSDSGYPDQLAVEGGRVVLNSGKSILESSGGAATPFIPYVATGQVFDVWSGNGALIASAYDTLFEITADGEAIPLSHGTGSETFFTGARVADGSYVVQFWTGSPRLVRVIP